MKGGDMASITQLLEALNTKAAAVSTADLATDLGASKEATLKQLKREKEKGNVDGDSEKGWLITDDGRGALEKGIHPSMIDEGVTPRQRFEAIGQRIGINKDRIVLAADIVWSGDYTDIKWVWEALGQADIADDLRSVWVNAWRAKLHKAIPPELATELTGAAKPVAGEAEPTEIRTKVPARDYIIEEDIPVRVGAGLGDYTMQDAKDILAIRALKNRLGGAVQAGGTQPAAMEKVSEILTALEPYINKGTDLAALKETLADKLALVRQEILSHIPQPGQSAQPKSFIEQLTDFIGVMSQMKNAGPMLKSILGIPETTANPFTPAQVIGLDGQPSVMDLTKVLDLRKFLTEERRADERHNMLMGIGQTIRENAADGISAFSTSVKLAVEGAKKGAGAPTAPAPQPTAYECGNCHTKFSIPDVPFETVKCPNSACGREYTKEEVMAA
jgi:biotin operon repressor